VVAGIAVLGLLALFLWGMATWISRGNGVASERIAPSELTVGSVDSMATQVEENGPLFFPELGTSIGTRSIVVDHTGDVAADGWRVYWAYPADREPTCVVEQVVGTRSFVDCGGRTVAVEELAPPDAGVFPRVDGRETLVIDLRNAAVPVTTTS
jgi:hypothetical protein